MGPMNINLTGHQSHAFMGYSLGSSYKTRMPNMHKLLSERYQKPRVRQRASVNMMPICLSSLWRVLQSPLFVF